MSMPLAKEGLKGNDMVDISVYRSDFPVLSKEMNGKPVIYLDTGASAQKPQQVLDAMSEILSSHYSNVHRGLYNFSQVNTEAFEGVRTKVARFISAPSDQEIVFTKNTTEAINLVAESWGRTFLKEGDEIIISEMEHHANIVPWQLLEAGTGVKVRVIPVLDNGELDLEDFERLLSDKTRFLAIVHTSNSLGTINPIQKMIKTAKAFSSDIMTLVDGSQAAVHGAVDVQELGCDFFVFTGHKLYGPNGVGCLWGKYDILNQMPPYQGGGDMIDTVSFSGTTFKAPPARFEAGTPAIVEVIGLGAAIDYVSEIGMENIAAHEKGLLDYAMTSLNEIEGLNFYGTAQNKAGIVSFTADWAHPSDMAMILDQQGVAIRTGHHCCMPLMERFGVDATARMSLGLYNNRDDIDGFVSALSKAKEMLS
ncbi:MAG: cysteine desulfurase [Pseudomonadota bacterium]